MRGASLPPPMPPCQKRTVWFERIQVQGATGPVEVIATRTFGTRCGRWCDLCVSRAVVIGRVVSLVREAGRKDEVCNRFTRSRQMVSSSFELSPFRVGGRPSAVRWVRCSPIGPFIAASQHLSRCRQVQARRRSLSRLLTSLGLVERWWWSRACSCVLRLSALSRIKKSFVRWVRWLEKPTRRSWR